MLGCSHLMEGNLFDRRCRKQVFSVGKNKGGPLLYQGQAHVPLPSLPVFVAQAMIWGVGRESCSDPPPPINPTRKVGMVGFPEQMQPLGHWGDPARPLLP